ncbi:MAG: hypothetical protein COA60_004880 [Robiginitomaculum sp.]|nr:hypothetical protein [Robiginitomaculum sp.]
MNLISPISAPFTASNGRRNEHSSKANDNKSSSLPAAIKPRRQSNLQTPNIYGQTAFAAHLLAGQPRRGIKASTEDQKRFFNAYAQSAVTQTTKRLVSELV